MFKSEVTSHYHNRSPAILIHCLIMYGCWAQCSITTVSTLPGLNWFYHSWLTVFVCLVKICNFGWNISLNSSVDGNRSTLFRNATLKCKAKPKFEILVSIKASANFKHCLLVTQRLQPECRELQSTKANHCQGGSGESPGPPYLT